ncbi:DUF4253 domain-containing protein [Actinomadura sp. ATCC 39365]
MEHRFGAVVVGVGFADLYVSVASPPATLQEALHVAAEHFAFCPDNITVAAYVERLVGLDSRDGGCGGGPVRRPMSAQDRTPRPDGVDKTTTENKWTTGRGAELRVPAEAGTRRQPWARGDELAPPHQYRDQVCVAWRIGVPVNPSATKTGPLPAATCSTGRRFTAFGLARTTDEEISC